MTIDYAPLTETLVRQLFELANTPFQLRTFRERSEAFGWSYMPAHSDDFVVWFQVSPGRFLMIDPLGDQVLSAMLPFYYWDEYDPEFCDSQEDYERGREAYHAEFSAAVELAERVLSSPAAHWHDADKDAHEAVVWAGEHGLLILQQANFDLQFGMEINFWLLGCTIAEFTPETPLIDWLCKRSRKLHEERGFPPLQW